MEKRMTQSEAAATNTKEAIPTTFKTKATTTGTKKMKNHTNIVTQINHQKFSNLMLLSNHRKV